MQSIKGLHSVKQAWLNNSDIIIFLSVETLTTKKFTLCKTNTANIVKTSCLVVDVINTDSTRMSEIYKICVCDYL